MKLLIDRPHVETLVREFPALAGLTEQLKFGNRAEVHLEQLDAAQLDCLYRLYLAAGPALELRAAQIAALRRALAEGDARYAETDLQRLLPALAEFLVRDASKGWLFRMNADGKPLAYLVTRLDYSPPGEEESGRILIELKANAMARIVVLTVQILERDLVGRTLPEILIAKGFLKETPELLAAYEHSATRFFEWRSEYGRQFSASGWRWTTGWHASSPSAFPGPAGRTSRGWPSWWPSTASTSRWRRTWTCSSAAACFAAWTAVKCGEPRRLQ
ncbi:hypothetical protein [Stutzerimonas stutzeri]|uniref:hypothetical protein n=1 Tax=Stutzerimonas stutzeri TaxID=316 RepID=UPI0022438F3D|nr:hypothetical protein [Stutzerimonas stutzeri]